MKCREAVELVERLADGEASASEERAVSSHIEQCERCRQHLAFVRAVTHHAHERSLPEPPAAYWEALPRKIARRLESGGPEKRGFFHWALTPAVFRWEAILATLLVAVSVGFLVLRENDLGVESEPVARPEAVAQTRPGAGGREASDAPDAAELEVEAPALEEDLEEEEAAEARKRQAQPELDKRRDSGRTAPSRASRPQEAAPKVALDRARPVAPAPAPQTETKEADEPREPSSAAGSEGFAPEVSRNRLTPAGSFRGMAGEAEPAAEPPKEEEAEREFRRLVSQARFEDLASSADIAEEKSGPRAEVDPCAGWRRYLERHGSSSRSVDARYQLARCSLRRYRETSTAEAREQAIRDARDFLRFADEGPRAREIRESLDELSRENR